MAFLLLISVLFFVRDIISLLHKKVQKSASPIYPGHQQIRRPFQAYEGILKSNPFGFPGGELKILTVNTGLKKSISRSDVTLIGVVSGLRSYSHAIFADKSGKQEVFKIGGSVFGLGRLERVGASSVFIKENDMLMEIPLTDVLSIVDIKPSGSSLQTSDFAKNTGDSTYILDQKKVLQSLDNPNQIMTDARLLPNFVDGKQKGFILREVRPGGVYQSLGLQNGDILLRINDFDISNPENALQAFTALRGMDRVQMDIIRNSARMTMSYQIR